MALLVHRSNRVEALADSLARVLCVPAGGPMQPEWVVVHSRGMERWLSQQLAQRLGVCANVHFPFPAKVLHELTGPAAPSGGAVGEAWSPPRLVWSILRQLPGLLGEEAFAPLLGCLGAGEQAAAGPDAAGMGRPVDRRAYLLARRIADTFDRYVTFRPEMVLGWDAPSQEEQDWQPLLWRSLRRVIAAPHLADLLRGPGAALRLDGLPPRLCFFAISTLPPFFLELLGRLAREREVYLFVLCPAREYTGAIRSRKEIARELKGALREGVLPEQLHLEEGNPLLASFGRLVREFQIVLEGTEAGCPYDELPGDLFVEPISAGGPGSPTMLQLLQSDVLHLRQRGTGRSDDPERFPPPRPVAAGDRSISIHACHGPMRQVEVLRDELLGLLAADPTLQPRDIVVMAPDIEAYAPLLEAVLVDGDPPRRGGGAAGAGAGAGAAPEVAEGEGQPGRVGFPSLPFRIADRSLRQENVVAEALLALLELAGGRTPASAVLDLLALPPVRRRFAIAAEELPMIRQWVGESGIRWGIDREHRQEHGQPGYQENTWRFGLDRLLLGVAMAGEGRRFFGGVLPYDELEGQTTDLCGRFVEFGETLFAELQELAAPRPLAGWRERLGRLLQAMTAVEDDEVWLQQQLRDLLDEIVQYAGNSGFSGELDRDCLSLLLEQGTSGKGPASGFGSGAITCCAMVPLRSIPFRVVCLLGMDDGAFPRAATRLGFDRLAADPRLGDRDPREEDRYLFLEALLSARQQLIITYTGRSIRDNERLPPAVPVGELLDVLSASFFPEEGGAEQAAGEGAGRAADLRERLISEHPLQPFSPQSFCAGGPGPRSFDLRYLAAARRLCGERSEPPPFFGGPLPVPPPAEASGEGAGGEHGARPVLPLGELVRFFDNPTRYLLERRLGIRLAAEEQPLADREPITLSKLEEWVLADGLLATRLAGSEAEEAWRSARGSGLLPLGRPGDCLHADLQGWVEPIRAQVSALRTGSPRTASLSLALRGWQLAGTIAGLWETGRVCHQYARVRARHLLSLWLHHLALGLASGEQHGCLTLASHLVGRPRHGEVVRYRLPPLAPDPDVAQAAARSLLGELLDLYRLGLAAPLLFFPETSRAFAEAQHRAGAAGADCPAAVAAAARAWSATGPGSEAEDAYVARVFGSGRPYEPGFALPGLPPAREASFAEVACRVWLPLLERLERREG